MTLMSSQLKLSKLKYLNQKETSTDKESWSNSSSSSSSNSSRSSNTSTRSTSSVSNSRTLSPPKINHFPLSFQQYRRAPARAASVLAATLLFISSFQNIHHYQVGAMSTKASSTSISTAATNNNSAPAALIFLHGLGDTPAGWSSLSKQLPSMKPSLANIQYVFPPAPMIPISINGGMTMPGWFDLYDWPIAVGCQHDHDGLGKAVHTVEEFVRKLESQGIPKNRIVIGGFSQGGAVALRAVYHASANKQQHDGKQEEYAACVNLSGWLTFDDHLSSSSTTTAVVAAAASSNHNGCKNVPLFWGHGSFDDKVLFEQQKYGVDKLVTEMNLQNVHDYSYPIGHGAHPDEMVMLAEFLDRVLFGNGENHDKEIK